MYTNGKVTLETNGLSHFAIVYDTISEPDGDTDDDRIIAIIIAVMFVVGAIGLLFTRRF